jgi:5-formaminoimidazole-4-carboxamide-1-beta-D-ribofuranosyl 5'-monophosphate synthetase
MVVQTICKSDVHSPRIFSLAEKTDQAKVVKSEEKKEKRGSKILKKSEEKKEKRSSKILGKREGSKRESRKDKST